MDTTSDTQPPKPWETPFQQSVMRCAIVSLLLNFIVTLFFSCMCGHLLAPGVLVFPVLAFIFAWFAFFASVQRPLPGRIFLIFIVVHATYVLLADILDVLYYGHHPLFRLPN